MQTFTSLVAICIVAGYGFNYFSFIGNRKWAIISLSISLASFLGALYAVYYFIDGLIY